MKILAFSDIVFPERDLKKLWKLIENKKEPDLILLAGDMVERNEYTIYKKIVDFVSKLKWKCPVVACPGNWEQTTQYRKITEESGDNFHFLTDQALEMDLAGKKVCIVGSIGCIDSVSMLDYGGVIAINDEFYEKMKRIENLIKKSKAEIKILLTHYAPTYKTLKGEPEDLFPVLGSEYMENVLERNKFTLAIHGHAHYGISLAFVKKIPIFNVSIPITGNITEIDTDNLPKE